MLLAASGWAATAPPPRPQPLYGQALIANAPEGAEMIGRPAPPWSFDRWVRGPALSLDRLRGKVVLLRWWTEGCSLCATTLPALEKLRMEHRDDLVVIGVFHPKPPHHVSDKEILKTADKLGFKGPIAVDERWSTLDRWWLDGHPDREFTSVSFLVDRAGVIRWLHPGGEYYPTDDPAHIACDRDWSGLERALDAVLDRGASTPTQ
jgi:thiol-disulfide isomerase/thioredoxin